MLTGQKFKTKYSNNASGNYMFKVIVNSKMSVEFYTAKVAFYC